MVDTCFYLKICTQGVKSRKMSVIEGDDSLWCGCVVVVHVVQRTSFGEVKNLLWL